MSCVVGIDPGLSGAVAVLDAHLSVLVLEDMPTMGKGKSGNQVNPAALAEILQPYAGAHAALERVGAMPGQGVSSMFSLGDSYGTARAVLAVLGMPVEIVTPTVWKKHYHLDSDKERSRTKAIELFPGASLHRKKDHGRAEALLLARWLATNNLRG